MTNGFQQTPVLVNHRKLGLHKTIVDPGLGSSVVLAKEPWSYVDRYLAKNEKQPARFFWRQSQQFYQAREGVDPEAAPLLLYYSFLNAAKALLSAKGQLPQGLVTHGLSGHASMRGDKLEEIGVTLCPNGRTRGVFTLLSEHYGEPTAESVLGLKQILRNIPIVHRAFCLTYKCDIEVFMPIRDPMFVVTNNANEVQLSAEMFSPYIRQRYGEKLPSSLVAGPNKTVISRKTVEVEGRENPTETGLNKIAQLMRELRKDLYYINGNQTLWYVKAVIQDGLDIQRQSTTLTMAAMHCLSSMSRYEPQKLQSLLNNDENWLLDEFIEMSGAQFIDEIASEITGHQILCPSVRSPS